MNNSYEVRKWERAAAPEASELRSEMEREGYSVFRWSDAPGSVYGPHEHAEDQSHWIISGRLELDVEGVGRVLLGPGDRDLMPAGTRHAARVPEGEPVVYLIGAKRS